MKKRICSWIVLCGLLLLPLSVFAYNKDTDRRAFLVALSDLQRHKQSEFVVIADHLKYYPLYPYLIYADLAFHLPQATPQQIQGFLTNYQDTPLAWHLRALWLNQLANHAQWKTYLQVYQPSKSLDLQCYQRQALWLTGDKPKALNQLSDLLGKSIIPRPCLWVMGQALSSGGLGEELLLDSIARAFDNNNLNLANQLSTFLPKDQKNSFILWRETAVNPLLILNPKIFSTANLSRDYKSYILLTAIQKITHKNPRMAAQVWAKVARQTQFDAEITSKATKIIALSLAEDHDPLAEKWLNAAVINPEDKNDKVFQEWRIRSALWSQDWPMVESSISALSPKDRQTSTWRYWTARALEARGQTVQAKNIYRDLSLHGDFYGQLASIQLKQKPLMAVENLKVSPAQINAIGQLPAMQRAYELYQLHWLPEAGQEWHWATSHMPQTDYLAAAELAVHWGWYERAIATVNLINDGSNISLRFPLAYREPVLQAAQKNGLNPAWMFALIRQESLFTADAQSSAGAVGLMQLLPSTASWIANKLHIPFAPVDLKNPWTNLSLGGIFLKQIAVKFKGNEIFATAAYNAGPNRVKVWVPLRAMPADIWIENIPYHETRTYVKNIMTSMTFYERELGLPLSLEQRVKPL